MKTRKTVIALAITLAALFGCEEEQVYNYAPPQVTLTSPENGAVITSPDEMIVVWQLPELDDEIDVIRTLYYSDDTTNWQIMKSSDSTSFNLADYCQHGKKYYWKVEAKNGNNIVEKDGILNIDATVVSSPTRHFFTSPQGVIELQDTSGHQFVILTWNDPENIDHIEITYQKRDETISEPIIIAAGEQMCKIGNLTNEEVYTFMVKVIDSQYGNASLADTVQSMSLLPNQVFDADMNIYNTVLIGEQIWLRENLRTSKWLDGKPLDESVYYKVNNDYYYTCTIGKIDSNPNKEVSYYTRKNEVCPASFHVANDSDWKALELYLGMSEEEVNKTGYSDTRGAEKMIGKMLKSTSGWDNNGNDIFFFSAKPAGYTYMNTVEKAETRAAFWSINYNQPWYLYDRSRGIDSSSDGIAFTLKSNDCGLSIRCVKNK